MLLTRKAHTDRMYLRTAGAPYASHWVAVLASPSLTCRTMESLGRQLGVGYINVHVNLINANAGSTGKTYYVLMLGPYLRA
jgi:hypothetical protein